jgi:cyclopropane fatty-acyl-phospholipid synthase-like methyltransferase
MSKYRERIYGHYVEAASASLAPDTIAGLAPRRAYLTRLIAEHFPADRNAAILELGCGHGALIHFAREAGYARIEGVDGSPSQVAAAKRLGIAGVREGDVRQALAVVAPASLDAIVAFDVIEHFDKDELIELTDAVQRALKPSGRWIVHVPNGASPFAGIVRYGDLTHELAFTTESLSQLLFSSGFRTATFHEDVPAGAGAKNIVRRLLWRVVRVALRGYIAVETGVTAPMPLTQNLLAVATK